MKVIVQRSLYSNVEVNGKTINDINHGLVLLVGFNKDDTEKDIDYLVKKIVNLRIFDDENHIMNKSIIDVKGEILSISQFTLYANCKNGNRPSYISAMKSIEASKLYKLFNEKLSNYITVKEGSFGSDMLINIQNDGPVTIILESRE